MHKHSIIASFILVALGIVALYLFETKNSVVDNQIEKDDSISIESSSTTINSENVIKTDNSIQEQDSTSTALDTSLDLIPEASSPAMLSAHPWTWVRTEYADKPTFISSKASSFIITFDGKDQFSSKTDCNGIAGPYSVTKRNISLGQMISTLMFCENSDEQMYGEMLANVTTYTINTKGELALQNAEGDITMIFK